MHLIVCSELKFFLNLTCAKNENMFVIIKKGEIVKSKSSQTNQGPQLVLIYYKTYFILLEKIFRRKKQTIPIVWIYRLISIRRKKQTKCIVWFFSLKFLRLNVLISSWDWLFTGFQPIRRKRNKNRKTREAISLQRS